MTDNSAKSFSIWPRSRGAIRVEHLLLHVVGLSQGDGAVNAAKRNLAKFRKSEGIPSERRTLVVRTPRTRFFEITQDSKEDDLIILGRRDAMPSGKLSEGHTMERVIRYAACPVRLARETG